MEQQLRPLELAASLFAHAVAGGADVATLGDADLGLPAHVERELAGSLHAVRRRRGLRARRTAADAPAQVPSVDAPGVRLETLPPGALVRFRGMVRPGRRAASGRRRR